ncbi:MULTISPECIES: TetR/AcrR family transcriptional regulator [unclassified Paraburkholderia]|uniref:TetR/AcrR family transcriptional regulator n=1 Tax=unclassified Paraburkholderia TaxID=2615204 RepID=UPI002AB60AA0|nr:MULTISPECIES: TetR/AcrR family transcriptional regulator [unclassified Paraburkholderia]
MKAPEHTLDSAGGAPGRPAARRPGRPSGGVGGAEQRARLIDAALVLFARQGILDTSLAAIAREAGVTPAMVHYYFKTRDQLIDVLIDERFVPLREALGDIFAEHPDDPVKALTALAQRFVAVGQRNPWFPPLWVRDVISEGGVLRQRMLERLGRENQEKAHTAIARWQREGRLNAALEPSLLFQSLMGLTLLPLATSQIWRGDAAQPHVGVETIARHAVALITQGVGPARVDSPADTRVDTGIDTD